MSPHRAMTDPVTVATVSTMDTESVALPGRANTEGCVDEPMGGQSMGGPSVRRTLELHHNSHATAMDVMDEIDQLVARHRFELHACFAKWIRSRDDTEQRMMAFEVPPCPGESPPPSQGGTQHNLLAPTQAPNMTTPTPSMVSSGGPPVGAIGSSVWSPRMHKANKTLMEVTARSKKRRTKACQEVLSCNVENAVAHQTKLQRIFSTRIYEWASGTLILLNAIFMGYQTQFNAVRALKDGEAGLPLPMGTPTGFVALQVLFTILFFLELVMRWFCEGWRDFFFDGDRWWNILDIWVVSMSIVDLVVEFMIDQQAVLQNISVLRVIRVIRVVRVARVIRVLKFFRELRMMIFSILGSMKSLLWVILVLAMTFYIFGITFTAATTSELDTTAKWQDESSETLRLYFGTMDRSVLSLFMAMSGGNDWGQYYDSLRRLQAPYRYLFLLFISFCVFAVVNIVTGVFVESALQSNNKDRDIIVHEELEAKKDYLQALREIFDEIDDDDNGAITLDEFEAKLDDERVIAYFNALKLDVSDARTLFWLLDYDHSEAVNIDEFLTGCYRLQGESRTLDVKLMQFEVRSLREVMRFHAGVLKEIMDGVQCMNNHKVAW